MGTTISTALYNKRLLFEKKRKWFNYCSVCVFNDFKVCLPDHISKYVDSEAKLEKFSINKLILRLFTVTVSHPTNEKRCVIGFRVHRGYIFIDSEFEETFCLDDDCKT